MNRDDLPYWLALWRTPHIGPAKFLNILQANSDINLKSYLKDHAPHNISIDWKAVEADLKWVEASPRRYIITIQDNNYPLHLREISQAPPLLFVEGDITLLSQPQIAMVGSRHPTPGGSDTAHQFAKIFAQHHWVITSGLALGIDAASHEGALETQGKTVAVMATGPDQIYPKRHQALAKKIIENGCIVTEFPTGVMPIAMNFPRRNRIISGLSRGVLVVEAAYASGSLVTAKYALEQNRDIFAVPGSIYNPLSRGCHALIKQGAKLAETPQDVIEELCQLSLALSTSSSNSTAEKIKPNENSASPESQILFHPLLAAIDFNPTPIDLIIERSLLSAEEVSTLLLTLELEGHIQSVPGGYTRKYPTVY